MNPGIFMRVNILMDLYKENRLFIMTPQRINQQSSIINDTSRKRNNYFQSKISNMS